MQWYEIAEKKVKVDSTDKALEFVRLRCQQTPTEHDRLTAGTKFGLIPVESIRGIIYTISKDMFMSQHSSCSERKKSRTDSRRAVFGWEN